MVELVAVVADVCVERMRHFHCPRGYDFTAHNHNSQENPSHFAAPSNNNMHHGALRNERNESLGLHDGVLVIGIGAVCQGFVYSTLCIHQQECYFRKQQH